MAKVCIICGNPIRGKAYKVKEDVVIRAIRKIKKTLNIAKNNELYVCEQCYQKYIEKRKAFEKNFMIASALAIGIILIAVFVPLLFGSLPSLMGFLYGIGLAILILALSLLSYMPAVEKGVEEIGEREKQKRKSKKR